MANIMLGWPNRATNGDVTLSTGSWRAGYPANNMVASETSLVARSTDGTTASTKTRIDLGTARTIRVISEHGHNFPQGSLRKVSAGTTAGASDLYAGSWHSVWGITFAESGIEWQTAADWWGDEIDSSIYGNPFMGLCVLGADVTARYWTVEWDVTANVPDYLQIGRLIMAPTYQPDFNAVYGLVDGWRDYSTQAQLESGGVVSYRRRAARTVEFSLPATHSGSEEYRIREMLRRQRTGGDVLYVPDPERLEQSQVKGFLGRLQELSGMQSHAYKFRSIGLKLTEHL